MVYENLDELKAQLEAKGWSNKEIDHTLKVLQESSAHKTKFQKFIEQSIFWFALLLLIVGNFAISVVLVPFMLVAGALYLYPGLFFIGLAFGKLFDIVIWDIEHLEHSTHIYPAVFLVTIAVINISIMTVINNQLASIIQMDTLTHSPIVVAVVYVSGFMIPHIFTRRKKLKEKFVS